MGVPTSAGRLMPAGCILLQRVPPGGRLTPNGTDSVRHSESLHGRTDG